MIVSAAIQNIDVEWTFVANSSTGTWTFSPPLNDCLIDVETTAGVIIFQLDTANSTSGAVFSSTTPLNWISPASQPDTIAVGTSAESTAIVIADLNVTATEDSEFRFTLNVAFTPPGGLLTIFPSTDPTIANTPIGIDDGLLMPVMATA